MITMQQIIDLAGSYIQDDSDGLETRLLAWANAELQRLAKMRAWSFLHSSATITLTSGVGTWPADYAKLESIIFSTTCLYPSDYLSDRDIAEQVYNTRPGYTSNSTGFTLYPTSSATDVTLNYQIDVPTYTIGQTTVFPTEMMDVINRGVLNAYYEYDMDERITTSLMMYQQLLKEAKKWDNKSKPMPRATNLTGRRTSNWNNV